MHTLGSHSLTQNSTNHERERKGKRWIFNLSSTPTKGSQSLRNFSSNPWEREREERRNPNLLTLLK